jgi:hypothetical protein
MNNNSTFAYVHTESGPIKPAKAVPIDMMKNIVASIQGKHIRGEKGTNWGDLAKKLNKDCNPHGYTTIQTILNKALTEAATQSVGQSMFRLDLGNVVCDSAHAKFKMVRKNHSVVVDMLYPNDNGNITIRYNVDDVAEKMFELSLDSEHYINGFGRTIINCCDDAIKDAEEMTDEEDIYSTDENGYQPIMSADMRGLLGIANAIMESDMGGGDAGGFGEADFAAPADAGVGMGGDMGGGAPVGNSGGNAAIGGDIEGEEDEVNFADECLSRLSTETSLDSEQNGSFARFTDILADKMANESRKNSHGIVLTGKQVAKGTLGIATTESASERISDFQNYYPQFKGTVTKKEMDAFLLFLESNNVNSALEFESWLLSNKTMQNLAQRKGVGRQAMTGGNSMDSLSLPDDGMGSMAEPSGIEGDMGGSMADDSFGMGFDNGGNIVGDTSDFGTDMAGADFGSGVDINAIGDIDKISENTSEELPNLGGESSESTKPADNTEQNV